MNADRMTTPVVSVIMPAYNAEALISQSISSVQAQTFQDWELIIVDDGSIDSTAHIVKAFAMLDQRIKYFWQPNGRLGAARNRGLTEVAGMFVCFIDSDDLWLPFKLEVQLKCIQEHAVDIIFTNGYTFVDDPQVIADYNSLIGPFSGAIMYKELFQQNYIAVLSVMMRKELLINIGLQDKNPDCFGCEDWDYWLRCAKAGARFYGMETRSFKYRVHAGGMSSDVLKMHMAGCYVLFKNYDKTQFAQEELRPAEARLVSKVHYIINQLYDRGEISRIPKFINKLSELSLIKIKTSAVRLALLALQGRSRHIVNYFLSQG